MSELAVQHSSARHELGAPAPVRPSVDHNPLANLEDGLPVQAQKMFRASLLKALQNPQELQRSAGSEGDITQAVIWFQQAFVFTFLSEPSRLSTHQKQMVDDFLLLAQSLGAVRKNELMDWTVDRGEMESHDSLGGTSTPQILDVLQGWTTQTYLDKGGGDNSHLDWVRQQRPEWDYHAVGDALYYSPGKVLHRFLLPQLQQDRDTTVFVRLLSVFLMHELKSDEYWQQYHYHDGMRTRTINDIFLLLADVACWLASHFDDGRGIYVASKEFEADSLAELEGADTRVFDRFAKLSHLISKKISDRQKDKELLRFFQSLFQPEFCQEIARFLFDRQGNESESALDLRRRLPVFTQGFVKSDFTDMPDLFPHKKFGYIRALRSDSHEDDFQYEKDIKGNLMMLDDGGVLHADGHRASYTRIDRTDILVRSLKQYPEGTFTGYAIVPKDAEEDASATSFWIQKAKDGQFFSPQQLAKCLDLEKYDLVPLEDYSRRFLVRFESEVRKLYYRIFCKVLGESGKAKLQFAHPGIKDRISVMKTAIGNSKPKMTVSELVEVFRAEIEDEAYFLASKEVARTCIPPKYSTRSPYSTDTYTNGPSLRPIQSQD